MCGFRLLVLADAHYAPPGAEVTWPAERHCRRGCELLVRAIEAAREAGTVDAVALMGDLLEDGEAPWAAAALRTVHDAVMAAAGRTPLLTVPGNHDGDGERFLAAFDASAAARALGGYHFVTFADAYAADASCTRRERDRRRLLDLAAEGGGAIVALQHNPLWPDIDSDYPYVLTNRDAVMADYARAGVLLSISGHYHGGQALTRHDGVHYLTVGCLCEAPYRYAIVQLAGRNVEVLDRRLAEDDGPT